MCALLKVVGVQEELVRSIVLSDGIPLLVECAKLPYDEVAKPAKDSLRLIVRHDSSYRSVILQAAGNDDLIRKIFPRKQF